MAKRKRVEQEKNEMLEEAHKRFSLAIDAESHNESLMLDDIKFANGDSDNFWQWPEQIRQRRENAKGGPRPCLTINKVKQHINQVVNDIRQNKPAIKCIPADDHADIETAEIYNGLVRQIQYVSDAGEAYVSAADSQVTCGLGYVRVITKYVDDNSFDQEIVIKRIRNPFTVYLDPNSTCKDGSDAEWGFVTEWITKEEFKRRYPGKEPIAGWDGSSGDVGVWYSSDDVRIAEYFCKVYTEDELILLESGETVFRSELPEDFPGIAIRSRKLYRCKVMWNKLCGHCVLEETEWPGSYIPIARAVGNEVEIQGKVYRSGLTRPAKDPQRMINYWGSQEVEMLALAPKAPFVGAHGQFEGFEDQWDQANQENYAYLEYNPVVDTANGNETPVPPPQRQAPPPVQGGIIQAKLNAKDDLKEVTGQYDASFGARGNETSGRAILARQREGDTATFHYIDNLNNMVAHVGRIVVDLIPKIYDTARIIRIMGEDNEPSMVQIDPNQEQAYIERRNALTKKIEKIYNLGIGKYDVMVIVGPSYTTKRQEAAQAMSDMTQANPQLWQVIGDLLVKNMDWPGSDEMAKRLKAVLLPQVQELADENGDVEIPPQVKAQLEQAFQQNEQLVAMLEEMQGKLQKAEADMQDMKGDKEIEQQKAIIDFYKAETDRIAKLQPAMTAEELAAMAAQIVIQAVSNPAPQVMAMEGQDQAMDLQEDLQEDMKPEMMQEEMNPMLGEQNGN